MQLKSKFGLVKLDSEMDLSVLVVPLVVDTVGAWIRGMKYNCKLFMELNSIYKLATTLFQATPYCTSKMFKF